MSKLSKISKVILLSGIFLVSLSLVSVDIAVAATQAEKAQAKADEAAAAKEQSDAAIKEWEKARDARDAAQSAYTEASMEYNKCVAANGAAACGSAKAAMEEAQSNLNTATENYNEAQKVASEYANDTTRAQNQADTAAQKAAAAAVRKDERALQAAERELNKAVRALEKCQKDEGADCSKEQAAVASAQQNVDSAQSKVDSHTKASSSAEADNSALEALQANFDNAASSGEQSDILNQMRVYKDGKEIAAAAAEAECERYSTMTSSDARDKAKEACAQAIALRAEADAANQAYEDASQNRIQRELDDSVKVAQRRLRSVGKGDTGIVDISQSRQIGDSGPYTLAGYRSQYFNYGSGEDVLDTVTRRAALTIASLKPIVYVFAGFGLIAFAWMAIFNKISWKWFANIAMGLFLVANMGRFIEYFVVGDGDQHYYVGVWGSNTAQAGKTNSLANAFVDSYYVYGDTVYDDVGIRYFKEQEAAGGGSTTTPEEFEASAPGFCQGTSGSGWENFTSCVNDVVSTAKKAADTAKDVKAAADDMQARVENIKDSAANIKQAAEAMKGASLTEIIANTGNILNNVNNMVSTTTGAVGSLTNTASSISNNVQDMGKSVEQQEELQSRRNQGEATNAVDAALKGQEWNSSTGGVENVDGQWAGQDNFITNANDFADDIRDKSSTINNSAQDMTQQVGAVTNIVESTKIGGESINDRRNNAQDAARNNSAANTSSNRTTTAGGNASYTGNTSSAARTQTGTSNAIAGDSSANDNIDTGVVDRQVPSTTSGQNTVVERQDTLQDTAVKRQDTPAVSTGSSQKETVDKQDTSASDTKAIAERADLSNMTDTTASGQYKADTTLRNDLQNKDVSAGQNSASSNTADVISNAPYEVAQSRQPTETTYSSAEKATVDNKTAEIEQASSEMAEAQSEYDDAVAQAQEARASHANALAEGKPQSEITKLQQAYNDKLTVMSDAKESYEQKKQTYDSLSEGQTAMQATVAKDSQTDVSAEFAETLSAMTEEDFAKFQAEAEAAKNNYITQKNKVEVAAFALKEKEAMVEQIKADYDNAQNQCDQTKDVAACRLAERLQKNYELSLNEKNTAQQEYDRLSKDLKDYEKAYKEKTHESEQYNQQLYFDEMQRAASDINTYEVLVSRQRVEVEKAARSYTQVKNGLQEGDEAGLKQAVSLYKDYKEAKDRYDEYQSLLNQARNKYATAQHNYQKSADEAEKLAEELSIKDVADQN